MGRNRSEAPSEKQIDIFRFIKSFLDENGYPPSIREIGEAVGLTSSSTVFNHLEALERKGYIVRTDGNMRGIKLIDHPELFPEDNKAPSVNTSAKQAATDTFNETPNDEVVFVPVIGRVAAGMPILAVENTERTFPVPIDFTKGKEVFMLKVKGESMIEAGIYDGDYVLVARQQTARDGDIIVALVDDSATVKTFYKEANCFRLQPENRTMKAIYVNELEVLGKVTGVFRRM